MIYTCPKCHRKIIYSAQLPVMETADGTNSTAVIPTSTGDISLMCPYPDCHYVWLYFKGAMK